MAIRWLNLFANNSSIIFTTVRMFISWKTNLSHRWYCLFFFELLSSVVSQLLNFHSEVFRHLSVSSRTRLNGELWATFIRGLNSKFLFQQNVDLSEIYIRIISRIFLPSKMKTWDLVLWGFFLFLFLEIVVFISLSPPSPYYLNEF